MIIACVTDIVKSLPKTFNRLWDKEDSKGFGDILHEVIAMLCSNYGFKQVDFQAKFSVSDMKNFLEIDPKYRKYDEQTTKYIESYKKAYIDAGLIRETNNGYWLTFTLFGESFKLIDELTSNVIKLKDKTLDSDLEFMYGNFKVKDAL